LHVRAATPEDAEAIARVEVASWRAAYAQLMPAAYLDAMDVAKQADVWRGDIAKHAALRRKQLLVAVQGREVVGFARVGPPSEARPLGMVYLLYVDPAHWGSGAGARLMQAALGEMADMQLEEAELWVLEANARARAFYEAGGWTPSGETQAEDYGGVRLTALRYRRDLP
jgi:GNAT superfamily N-acetyltransferase